MTLKTNSIIIAAVVIIVITLITSLFVFEKKHEPLPENVAQQVVQEKATANDLPKEKVEEIVKNYIMNNPEIIINSVENYQNIKAKEQVDQVKSLIRARYNDFIANGDDPKAGSENAKVKLIEFFDYNCSFCKRMLVAKTKLIENNKNVEIIFKELPILGESSVVAAKAALAVNIIDKSKYFAFHSALMQYNGQKNEDAIIELANKVGVNSAALKEKMNDPKVVEILHNNHKLAKEIGLQGTPAYIIGDDLYPGALTYDDLVKKIEALS
jgi:protein-disulfide isomerase